MKECGFAAQKGHFVMMSKNFTIKEVLYEVVCYGNEIDAHAHWKSSKL